jgi:hypothetical protein
VGVGYVRALSDAGMPKTLEVSVKIAGIREEMGFSNEIDGKVGSLLEKLIAARLDLVESL